MAVLSEELGVYHTPIYMYMQCQKYAFEIAFIE